MWLKKRVDNGPSRSINGKAFLSHQNELSFQGLLFMEIIVYVCYKDNKANF